jgi:uncharacterized protein YjbI with pentapeptide repeats
MADEKKPSIYHDRGTIGSAKELDEYGVWVKSEPQILDSGGDEMGGDDLSLDIPDDLPGFSTDFDDNAGSDSDALDFSIPDELDTAPAEGVDDFSIPAGEDALPDFSADFSTAEEGPEDQEGEAYTDMSLEDLLGGVADELPEDAEKTEEPADPPAEGAADMSTQLLLKIAGELSSIRKELSALKQEFAMARGETAAEHGESRGFFNDSNGDDKIALTGDELDNIINTADFTEETGADATEEAPDFSEEAPEDAPPEAEDVLLTETADLSPEDPSAEALDFSLTEEDHPELPEISLDDAGFTLETAEAPEDAVGDEASEASLDEISLDESSLADISLDDIPDDMLTALDETSLADASPDDASLDIHSLDSLSLDDSEAGGADLSGADLGEVVLDDADLGGVVLDDAALGDVVLDDIDMGGADLGDASLGDSSPDDLDAISLDDSLEGISLGGEEIVLDDFEDAIDLSGAVIEEPDLGLEIEENPVEEPVDLVEDEAVSPEAVLEEPEEAAEEPLVELLDEPVIPEIESVEDEKEISRAEESAAEIPSAGGGASGGEDLEQIIPEGFLLEDLDEGEADFGGAGLDTLEEGVSPDDIPEDVLPEEDEELPVQGEAVLEPELSALPGNFKKELKQVLSYMDQLLESLPEEKIEEFAQSEYFDTYKKLFKELGLA